MPDTDADLLRRLDLVERDTRDHAKSITALTEHIGGIITSTDKKDAVRIVQDEHLDERLDRIERSIAGIYKLGWWILGAFGASAIALVANFAFRGGFVV